MKLRTGFSCNSVVWISSLPSDEQGPSRRMADDIEQLSQLSDFHFERKTVQSADELDGLLEELSFKAREDGIRPILNFDMHGGKDSGLNISGTNDFISWDSLTIHLRKLNTCTGNNLCVIGAACFGLRAIMPIKLDQPTPFFILLAPEEEISVGFLEKNLPAFYRELFQSGSLNAAYDHHLSEKFKYFHCEKMLFIVVARYIHQKCRGKSAQERRERLLTELFLQGMQKTESNLKNARKRIKIGMKPNQALLDRYARVFLINKPCSFDFDQLMAFVDGYDA